MDLVRYLRVLRRRWRVIAVVAALGAVAGLLLAPRPSSGKKSGEAVYLAEHVLWSSSGPAGSGPGARDVNLNRIAELVTTGPVPERVARKIGGTPTSLARDVIARPDTGTGSIKIWARGSSPARTAEMADEFALETIRYEEERANADIDARLQRLQDELVQRQLEYAGLPETDTVGAEGLNRRITAIQAEISSLQNSKATMATLDSVQPAEAFEATSKQVETVFTRTPTQGNKKETSPSIDPLAAANAGAGEFGLHPVLGGVIGAGVGGALGIMLVLAIHALDPRLFTKEDAEATLGFNVIAEIPAFSRKLRKETIIVSREAPYSRFADAYRVLRSSILFVERQPQAAGQVPPANGNGNGNADHTEDEAKSHKATVVMITSPGPSEGKTTTVSNLATVLAEDGRRVLVVNCDFRRPRLHTFLGGGEEPRKVFDTQIPGVKLVTGVVANPETVAPAEVIAAQRRLIENAHEHFDYVLLDTAPILTTNDASELLPVTDMVVMICRSGKTTRESADRAAELLERFEAPVIGAALVGATDSPASQYYYYYSSAQPRRDDEQGEDGDDTGVDADAPRSPLEGLSLGTKRNGKAKSGSGKGEASDEPGDESRPAEVTPSVDEPKA